MQGGATKSALIFPKIPHPPPTGVSGIPIQPSTPPVERGVRPSFKKSLVPTQPLPCQSPDLLDEGTAGLAQWVANDVHGRLPLRLGRGQALAGGNRRPDE